MRIRFFPLTISLLAVLCFACGDRSQGDTRLPGPGVWGWGEPLDVTAARLVDAGWQRDRRVDDQVFLKLPDVAGDETITDDSGASYRLILIGDGDKLIIARLQAQASTDSVIAYERRLKDDYELGSAGWSTDETVEQTQSGNRILDRAHIYEAGDLLIRTDLSRTEFAEGLRLEQLDLSEANAAVLEATFYYIPGNEGISLEALVAQAEAE